MADRRSLLALFNLQYFKLLIGKVHWNLKLLFKISNSSVKACAVSVECDKQQLSQKANIREVLTKTCLSYLAMQQVICILSDVTLLLHCILVFELINLRHACSRSFFSFRVRGTNEYELSLDHQNSLLWKMTQLLFQLVVSLLIIICASCYKTASPVAPHFRSINALCRFLVLQP